MSARQTVMISRCGNDVSLPDRKSNLDGGQLDREWLRRNGHSRSSHNNCDYLALQLLMRELLVLRYAVTLSTKRVECMLSIQCEMLVWTKAAVRCSYRKSGM